HQERPANREQKHNALFWATWPAQRHGEVLLKDIGHISANHNKFAVRHVDDLHQAKGKSQAKRGQEQDRTEAQPIKNLLQDDAAIQSTNPSPFTPAGRLNGGTLPTSGRVRLTT